jgi:hypothetical protein
MLYITVLCNTQVIYTLRLDQVAVRCDTFHLISDQPTVTVAAPSPTCFQEAEMIHISAVQSAFDVVRRNAGQT